MLLQPPLGPLVLVARAPRPDMVTLNVRLAETGENAAHLAIPGRGVLFIESTHSHNWGLYLQLLSSFTKPRRAIDAFSSQSDVGT